MEKIPHTIGNEILILKCGFVIGYSINQKYQPIWVSVLVSYLNQNCGFGRTLLLARMNKLDLLTPQDP